MSDKEASENDGNNGNKTAMEKVYELGNTRTGYEVERSESFLEGSVADTSASAFFFELFSKGKGNKKSPPKTRCHSLGRLEDMADLMEQESSRLDNKRKAEESLTETDERTGKRDSRDCDINRLDNFRRATNKAFAEIKDSTEKLEKLVKTCTNTKVEIKATIAELRRVNTLEKKIRNTTLSGKGRNQN